MVSGDLGIQIFNGSKLSWQNFGSLGTKKVEKLFGAMLDVIITNKVNRNIQEDLHNHIQKTQEDYIRRSNIFLLLHQFVFRS